MTTAVTIIRRAMRLIGVLGPGQEPQGLDAQDALERLQSMILDLPGLLRAADWFEKEVGADYTARPSQSITVTAPAVITLPTTLTYSSPAKPIYDLARVRILGDAMNVNNAGLWIYSATKAKWGRADNIDTLQSELPFGPEDDGGLAALLAAELVAEYGAAAELDARTTVSARTASQSFRSRFKKYPNRCDVPLDYLPWEYASVYTDPGPY